MSPEEFFEWEEHQLERHEYYDGLTAALSRGTVGHSRIATNLIIQLGISLSGSLCQVHGPDMRIAVGPKRFVYPDLSVVCGDLEFVDARRTTLVNPTVVVEVLSPSTALHDKGSKFEAYRGVESLQEVVFVDPARRAVEVYRRGAPWTLHEPEAGDVVLASVDARVALEAIYAGTDVA